ncbi:MAG TPA: ABC transporter transmembrane domain-containing protein, partial [Puia sp.]|nr:ABC transporter transmembrane domain-containing protein [Puia sp.]
MSSQNYNLNSLTEGQPKSKTWPALVKLIGLLPEQRGKLILALATMVLYAILSMLPPVLIGFTINKVLLNKEAASSLDIFGWHVLQGSGYGLVLTVCGVLLVIYLLNLGAVYMRTILMGGFGQHLLFTLRNAIFNKLQELPVAFFARNKAGDLISRI